MRATASVRYVWDRAAIRALRTDPYVVAEVERAGAGFARYEAALAPKRTGAGAASIQPRSSRSPGAVDVAWDNAHHYMAFQNWGTEHVEARLFAQQALQHYIHF